MTITTTTMTTKMYTIALPLLTIFLCLSSAYAADNGMDMSMDGAMSLASGSMRPYIHFTPGDTLWFFGWVPLTSGAMAGACIGLFLIGLVERWFAALRAGAERGWRVRAHQIMANRANQSTEKGARGTDGAMRPGFRSVLRMRGAAPFVAAHDVMRGVLYAGQAALGFMMMLAVMTYNAAFIICLIAGLGVGEILFGRFIEGGRH